MISLCLPIEFDAREAWSVIQKLAFLPDEQPFDIIGDGVHEILPTAVALWGTDDIEQLTRWCLDTNVNKYCRSALARGVCEAYGRGLLYQETVLDFNKRLLEQAAAGDHEFRAFVICDLIDLQCDELAEVIHDVFERDLVETFIVSEDCVELEFSKDKETGLQKYRSSLVPLDNFTDLLQSWSSFKPKPKYDPPAPIRRQDPQPVPFEQPVTETLEASPRIRRNDPCPCGSGKKFKKCCKNA